MQPAIVSYGITILAGASVFKLWSLREYCLQLRAYVFMKRLEHIRSWNGVFNEQTLGYANEYARDYKRGKLLALRKEYRLQLRKTYGGNSFTFLEAARIAGYKKDY